MGVKFPFDINFSILLINSSDGQKDNAVNMDPINNVLKEIEAAGNWPVGMEPRERVLLTLSVGMVTMFTVIKEDLIDPAIVNLRIANPFDDDNLQQLNRRREHGRLSPTYYYLLPYSE